MSNFPKEWSQTPFKSIKDPDDRYSFTGGPFGSDLMNKDYQDIGVRVVQLQNIGEGKFNTESKIYTSEEKADSLSTCIIFPGDIVLSKMAEPIARACIVPAISKRYLMCSDGIRVSVDKNKYDTAYSCYFINSNFFRNEAEIVSTGTTRKRIGLTELAALPFFSPLLKEQKKIAEILISVDKVIELTEIEIEKFKNLKKGMMQNLLTRGIGHTKFKDSPIGKIPESWDVVPLKYYLKIKGGFAFKSTDSCDNGARWLKIANANHGGVDWSVKSYLPISYLVQFSDYVLNEGDMVLALTRPITRGVLKISMLRNYDSPCLLNQRVGKIEIKDEEDRNFIFFLMQSDEYMAQLESDILGTDPPNLSPIQAEKFKVPKIPEKERRRIGEIVMSVERVILAKESKLKAVQNMKKGLMQDLLTGKVRVKL